MWSDRVGVRLGALAGIPFIVLAFVSNAMLVGSLTQSDSAARVVKVFADEVDQYELAMTMSAVSAAFLLFFAGSLREVLARSEGREARLAGVAQGAAIGGVALVGAGMSAIGGAAWLAEYSQPSAPVAAFAHAAAESTFFYSLVFFGVVALATGIATLRHGALPGWFGWLASVLGIAMIVGGAGAPMLHSLGFLGGVCFPVFFLIAPILVWRRAGAWKELVQTDEMG
jgi:hypothetical protein